MAYLSNFSKLSGPSPKSVPGHNGREYGERDFDAKKSPRGALAAPGA